LLLPHDEGRSSETEKQTEKLKGRPRGLSFDKKALTDTKPKRKTSDKIFSMPPPTRKGSEKNIPNQIPDSNGLSKNGGKPMSPSTSLDSRMSNAPKLGSNPGLSDNSGGSTGDLLDLYSHQGDEGDESCDSMEQENASSVLESTNERECGEIYPQQTDNCLRGVLLIKFIGSHKDLNRVIQSGAHWRKRIGKLEGCVLVLSKDIYIKPSPVFSNRKISVDMALKKERGRASKMFAGKAPQQSPLLEKGIIKSTSNSSLTSGTNSPSQLKDFFLSENYTSEINSGPSSPANAKIEPKPRKLSKFKGSWENLKSSVPTVPRIQSIIQDKVLIHLTYPARSE
jgi:hypothetical protein